jgi:crotonobetainyl-CoA:carnitine CoA-transferase CaiB-like acyl-CoA transferase
MTHYEAVLFGADSIIASPEEKARLFASYGAVAVDMESHGAARAAKAAGVPFLAIRAIADPAERALPKAALGAVGEDGRPRVPATLLECAKRPQDFPALLQLGRDSDAALKTLGGSLDRLFAALLLRLDL